MKNWTIVSLLLRLVHSTWIWIIEASVNRDKLAYSENQASKNLKLYRVKQQEVLLITLFYTKYPRIIGFSTELLQVELAQAKAAGLEDALETVKREKEERRRRREQGKNVWSNWEAFTFFSMGNLTRLALLAPTQDVCIGLKYFAIRFLRFYL